MQYKCQEDALKTANDILDAFVETVWKRMEGRDISYFYSGCEDVSYIGLGLIPPYDTEAIVTSGHDDPISAAFELIVEFENSVNTDLNTIYFNRRPEIFVLDGDDNDGRVKFRCATRYFISDIK